MFQCNEVFGTSYVFASGTAREKDREEKSKYGSDQRFYDRVVVKRPDSSTSDQKATIRHSYSPENHATTAHGAHLSISRFCHTLSLRTEDFVSVNLGSVKFDSSITVNALGRLLLWLTYGLV
jgi:hypothetical protein